MKTSNILKFAAILFLALFITSCVDDEPMQGDDARLILKFKFDPNQARLGNFGETQNIPSGHAAQSPEFNLMGAHYIEISQNKDIPAYGGVELYQSPLTSEGGEDAIDFTKALYGGNGEIFFTTNLSNIPTGTYENLRISLSYQNYTIDFKSQGLDLEGTIASFVGANTYINDLQIKDKTIAVNSNKKQGYWAFETDFPGIPVVEGQAPEGATTVPNPLAQFSAIPAGSCLVTGIFSSPLEITGNEISDIVITCSISTNDSFEWKDINANGTFEPTEGDEVVDMGVRGLIPIIE